MLQGSSSPFVAVIEDDDWYAPDWLEWCCDQLSSHALVGEGRSIYYNVRSSRWMNCQNTEHASLCATAFRRELIPEILEILAEQPDDKPFVDIAIWKRFGAEGLVLPDKQDLFRRVVGMKGLPGRPGIGIGHRHLQAKGEQDPDGEFLAGLIGPDSSRYEKFRPSEQAYRRRHRP